MTSSFWAQLLPNPSTVFIEENRGLIKGVPLYIRKVNLYANLDIPMVRDEIRNIALNMPKGWPITSIP